MTGGIDKGSLQETDVTQWISMGPVTLEAGDSTVFAAAVVSGTSVDDFLENVDQAQSLWQSVGVKIDENPKGLTDNDWVLSEPYPHPAAFPLNLRYESSQSGHVELTRYDILGRRVKELIDAPHSQGHLSVVWDGTDNMGVPVASGM